MSTAPRTQAAFVQGNQSTVGQDTSQSALFYLFQEVSKLESPLHSSFMDTHSPSTWQDPFTVEREEEDAHLFPPFNSYSQSPNNSAKNVQEESHADEITAVTEPHPECNSPLKVLTLINLQCERLLHPRDAEKSRQSSLPSITESGHSRANSSPAAAFVTGQGVISDSRNFKVSLGPLINERQEITTSVSHVKDVKDGCSLDVSGYKPPCSGKDSKGVCNVKPQTAGNTETVRPERLEENAETSSRPPPGNETDVKFGVSNGLEWDNEQRKGRLSAEQHTSKAPFPEDAPSETHISNASCNDQQLTFDLNEDASVAKPALTLDHNANVCLSTNPTYDALLPQSALLRDSSSERCYLIDKSTASTPESRHSSTEETSLPVSQLKSIDFSGETTPTSSATLKPEPRPMQKGAPCTQQRPTWRAKTPRKQPRPSRSADIQDPDFQGVTFRMDTEVDDSSEQCRLLITSKYSKELPKSVRKPRLRTRSVQKSLKTSSSEEESDQAATVSSTDVVFKSISGVTLRPSPNVHTQTLRDIPEGKVCASCCTRKTPMWRDAEDGTPLCNACGIRYKKYRVRCVNCWHIPRKEGNSNSRCLKCGNFVRLTSAQRKRTT